MTTQPTRLVLVRHGQSEANLAARFTRSPDDPLTELGLEQARERARLSLIDLDAGALYSSPFRRAYQTALEIGGIVGLEPIVVDDLREQDFGDYRGRPYEDFYGQHPAGSIERWDHRPPGGETLREVADRAGRALDEIAAGHPGETAIVVCHGGVMSAVRAYVRAHYGDPPVPTVNAGGYVLLYDGSRWDGPEDLP